MKRLPTSRLRYKLLSSSKRHYTQNEISEIFNISKSTVSRAFTELFTEKYLDYDRHTAKVLNGDTNKSVTIYSREAVLLLNYFRRYRF